MLLMVEEEFIMQYIGMLNNYDKRKKTSCLMHLDAKICMGVQCLKNYL